jgi:hypothetical protein
MGWIVSVCRLFHRKILKTPKQPPWVDGSKYPAIPSNILVPFCSPVRTDPGIFAGFLWLFPSVLDLPEYDPLWPCEVQCFSLQCENGRRNGPQDSETRPYFDPV